MTVRAWIGLGSNRGPRRARIEKALTDLGKIPGTRLVRRSSIYESPPFDLSSQPDYFNAVALIETSRSPMGLLAELKRLEWRAGRRPGRRWAPRTLDLDLLLFGSRKLEGHYLTVPHPLWLKRLFVVAPLLETGPPRALERGLRTRNSFLKKAGQNAKIVA